MTGRPRSPREHSRSCHVSTRKQCARNHRIGAPVVTSTVTTAYHRPLSWRGALFGDASIWRPIIVCSFCAIIMISILSVLKRAFYLPFLAVKTARPVCAGVRRPSAAAATWLKREIAALSMRKCSCRYICMTWPCRNERRHFALAGIGVVGA